MSRESSGTSVTDVPAGRPCSALAPKALTRTQGTRSEAATDPATAERTSVEVGAAWDCDASRVSAA